MVEWTAQARLNMLLCVKEHKNGAGAKLAELIEFGVASGRPDRLGRTGPDKKLGEAAGWPTARAQ